MNLGFNALGLRQSRQLQNSLNLDFTLGSIDSRLTCSGGANGTAVNSSGNIAAATCPRFDYDPVTRACKGLLIEEQRTNLLLRSAEFDNASWSKNAATVTANATTGPDGTASADLLIPDGTSTATHQATQTYAGWTSGTTYTLSCYMKASGYQYGRLILPSTAFGAGTNQHANYDLANGTTNIISGTGTSTITAVGNGWYRCTLTATADVTISATLNVRASSVATNTAITGDGTSGIYIWGAQLEAGAFATSYIPTTSATVTRTADSVTMTDLSWYRQHQGTFVVGADTSIVVSGGNLGLVSVDSASQRGHCFHLGTTGIPTARSRDASVSVGVNLSSAITANTAFKVAGVLTQALRNGSVNGAAVASESTIAAVPDNTQLTVGWQRITGTAAANYINGHVRTIQYYTVAANDSQLKWLSTLT